eukprot:gene4224-biopygen21946
MIDSDRTGRMTLVTVQESDLELGTATQQARHSPEIGLIPSPVYAPLLAAMDTETRQAFRAVSKSCRHNVHAYTTTLRSSSKPNGPRQSQESIAIPKCPNVRSLEIQHFPGLSYEGPFPASMRSLEVTSADYDRLCRGALPKCTGLEELTLYGCEALQQMPSSLAGFSKALDLSGCNDLVDVSALVSRPNLKIVGHPL